MQDALINQLVVRRLDGHWVLKSNGFIVIVEKITEPRKGELYLKPTGKKNTWVILQAPQDCAKKNRPIISYVKRRVR